MEILQLVLIFVTGIATALTISALSSYQTGKNYVKPQWYSAWCQYWFIQGRSRRLVSESRTASKFQTTDIPAEILLDDRTPASPEKKPERLPG